MKKIFLIAILLLSLSVSAFAQVENVARDVLTAYKNRDVELFKKHAPAIFKVSLSKDYFKDSDIQEDLKAVDNWDGKIREVRYESKNMMGANVVMATVYFADVPGEDGIYAVLLSNFNNTGWAIFGNGLSKVTKEEFARLSQTVPKLNTGANMKMEKKTKRNLNAETADGNTFSDVTEEKLAEIIESLNDDNFYIILNDGSNYLQVAYSDKGYTVEYQDKGGHFTAHELLSKDETLSLFEKYYQGKENWEEDIIWDKE